MSHTTPSRAVLPRRLACVAVLAFAGAVAAPSMRAQQAPVEPAAPKGEVLFEGHQPVPTDDVPVATPVTPDAPVKPGVSTSRKRPALRQRSLEPATDASGSTVVDQAAVPAVSSSSSSEEDAAQAVLVTDADRKAAARVTAAERSAVLVTATELDLHLRSHTGVAEVRALVTVRNTGATPLRLVPLRISGALKWESVRLAGAAAVLPLEQHRLPDDLDHTGVATEVAVELPEPLAPGAETTLDLYYGGVLSASTQRLVAIGAPSGRAGLVDWDTVTDTFTGLRGAGNVLWYPVPEPPAFLRDGSAVVQAVERSRERNAASRFGLRLTLEYDGVRPEAAFFCGQRAVLKPLGDAGAAGAEGGVVVAEWNRAALGPHTPSLFVAQAAPQEVAGGLLRVVTDRADAASALGEAAGRVKPMLAEWMGAAPLRSLDVIDLAIPGAAGFADGPLLVAPLTTGPATVLAPAMVGPLTASWMPADVGAAWLRDGLPAFMQAVWAERTEGRPAALKGLAANRGALREEVAADAAISSAVSSSLAADAVAGTPLASCSDPACSRAKAAYVLEMLRAMLGDAALQQALSGWRVAVEAMPQRTAADETAALERLLQQVAGKRDLKWFFGDWIDTDKGLPELSIVTVAPRKVERNAPVNYLPPKQAVGGPIGPEPVPKPGDPESTPPRSSAPGDRIGPAPGSWLVAVEVQNAGGADAEVPVTVRAGGLTNTMPLHVPAHGRATIRVPFEADPEEVIVNDGSVPEARDSTHRRSINGLGR